MHETGLVRDLLGRIAVAAAAAGAERVRGVTIRLGALSQISPEHFRAHFEEESRGTPAEGAMLTIEDAQDIADPRAQHVLLQSLDLDVPDGVAGRDG